MKRRAPFSFGASGLCRRGFTLLEMCIVLFIIMLLAAVALPSIQNAFLEQSLRGDARTVAVMVKTGMFRSTEERRLYSLDFTSTAATLYPRSTAVQTGDNTTTDGADNDLISSGFDGANKLETPNPDKKNGWLPLSGTSWGFEPGELCPATRVRISRDEAYIEMNFNALTGNVEDETSYIP